MRCQLRQSHYPQLVADDSVDGYEKARLPQARVAADKLGPADRASGPDAFDAEREACRIETRGLVYQKTG